MIKVCDKQFGWLRILYKCSELRMIRLNRHELVVLNDSIYRKEYNTYTRPTLNELRDRYKIPDLNQMLDDHKSRWGKYSQHNWTSGGIPLQYNSKRVIGTSSGLHPTAGNHGYVRNAIYGKPIVTGTGGSGFDPDWYQKQWQHFGQLPIEMKDLRPNNNKENE